MFVLITLFAPESGICSALCTWRPTLITSYLSAPCSLAPRWWGRSGSQMWLWSRATRGYSRSSKGEKEAHLGYFFLVSSPSQSPVFATAAPPELQRPMTPSSPAPPSSHWASGPPLLFSTPLIPGSNSFLLCHAPRCNFISLTRHTSL